MEIFQNALLWLLVFCMFVLLFRIKLEKNINEKLKNEIISLKSNHKKMQDAVSQKIQDLTNLRGSLILEKIELEKEKHNFKTDRKTYEKNIQKSLNQLFRLTTNSLDENFHKISANFHLYPELKFVRNDFSAKKIADNVINITESTSYKEYKQRKIKSLPNNFEVNNLFTHGYIYTMYNLSIPGVVKIGCSDAPQIRAKELTVGEDFRSNIEYVQCKKNLDKYHIGSDPKNDNLLREYAQNLNLKLKTSLPSPFIVAFFFESFEAYNDECLLHFALKDFNVYRGAGTEFFTLSLHQAYEVFKNIFPNRAYQYPNFTPPKQS